MSIMDNQLAVDRYMTSAVCGGHLFFKFMGLTRISGFSWHRKNPNRLLVVAPEGSRGSFDLRLVSVSHSFIFLFLDSCGFFTLFA